MGKRTHLPLTGTARAIRELAGIGPRELMRRLGYRSAGSVVNLEAPERSPSLAMLARVAEACGFRLVIAVEKIDQKK